MKCINCSAEVDPRRAQLGVKTCHDCGDKEARLEIRAKQKRVIPAFNKGGYVYGGDSNSLRKQLPQLTKVPVEQMHSASTIYSGAASAARSAAARDTGNHFRIQLSHYADGKTHAVFERIPITAEGKRLLEGRHIERTFKVRRQDVDLRPNWQKARW